jgi:hypothetical protein
MLNTRRFVTFWILIGFALLTSLVFYFVTQPLSMEQFFDRSVVILVLITIGLITVALFELKASRRIRISKHYSLFGPGYGFLKTLKKLTAEMEELRKRQESDEISTEDLERLESQATQKLAQYVSDSRWSQVLSLKKVGEEDQAKILAREIRKNAGF